MRLPSHPDFHLTYCTNIHPADGWDGVLSSLRRYAPALRRRFAPDVTVRRRAAAVGTRCGRAPHRHQPVRVPQAARRRGAVRRRDQRLSVRAVPRHAGEGQRLRARLARSRAGVLHARPDSHPAGARARGRRRGRVNRTAFLQAVDGGGRERRLGDDDAQRRARRREARADPPGHGRAHPSRHRAGARLHAGEHRRDPRVLRAPPAADEARRSSRGRCTSPNRWRPRSCSSTSASVSTAATSRSSSRTPPRR